MATIDARCKLLGQAGALPQVRVYSGVPITSKPSGKSVLKVHQRFLSAVRICLRPQPCDSLSGSQMRAQQRCRKASCAAPLSLSAVCAIVSSRSLFVFVSACIVIIYIYIYFITYWGETKKIRTKEKVFYAISSVFLPDYAPVPFKFLSGMTKKMILLYCDLQSQFPLVKQWF